MGLTGARVSEIHKSVVAACKAAELFGWDLLSCIVDGMQVAYGKITTAQFTERHPKVKLPIIA